MLFFILRCLPLCTAIPPTSGFTFNFVAVLYKYTGHIVALGSKLLLLVARNTLPTEYFFPVVPPAIFQFA